MKVGPDSQKGTRTVENAKKKGNNGNWATYQGRQENAL